MDRAMARIETWYVGCINIKPKPKYGRNSSSTVLKLKNCSLSQKLVLNFFSGWQIWPKIENAHPRINWPDPSLLLDSFNGLRNAQCADDGFLLWDIWIIKNWLFSYHCTFTKILSNLYSSRWMKHHICEQFLLSSCQRVEVAM